MAISIPKVHKATAILIVTWAIDTCAEKKLKLSSKKVQIVVGSLPESMRRWGGFCKCVCACVYTCVYACVSIWAYIHRPNQSQAPFKSLEKYMRVNDQASPCLNLLPTSCNTSACGNTIEAIHNPTILQLTIGYFWQRGGTTHNHQLLHCVLTLQTSISVLCAQWYTSFSPRPSRRLNLRGPKAANTCTMRSLSLDDSWYALPPPSST